MRTRQLAVGATAAATALAALALPAAAVADQPGVGYTRIDPIGKTSTGTGSSIRAEVATVDTGNSISTTGVGSGFQKQGLYVSVLYENGSMATGDRACLPAGKVPFGDRVIGAWVPDGATDRVLAPVTEVGQAYDGGHLVGSWDQGTVSVRMVNLIRPPYLYANLQACGRVHTTSTASTPISDFWANALSTVDGLPGTSLPSIPTLRSILDTPRNPIAPALPVGVAPVHVAAPSATRTVVQTVVHTTTVHVPPVTVSVPKVTSTTVTVPKVTTATVTVPKVTTTTVTVPTTVTIPPLTRP